jgi:hypothetical protein
MLRLRTSFALTVLWCVAWARNPAHLTTKFSTRRAPPDRAIAVSKHVTASVSVVGNALHALGQAISILRAISVWLVSRMSWPAGRDMVRIPSRNEPNVPCRG